ncbi:DUF1292 domain-containing protein [Kallipyga gabonensis]|uniref:DUF1292 domain-containing protein n=1 Tax=Kallipyga gabonensis TaxID=1686287 RepID=UPI0006B43714|nr:DUF1292 domain-containing protein [Kallipyga gabonensis]
MTEKNKIDRVQPEEDGFQVAEDPGKNDHDCNCGHDHHDHEKETLLLTLEDDSQVECEVLAVYPLEEKEYIALLAVDDEDGRVLLYEYQDSPNSDEVELTMIESEEEFDRAAEEFTRLIDEEEMEMDEFDDEDIE